MRHFGPDYVEQATTSDGTPVVLRLVRPGDKELLRSAFERYSPESRYARFLGPKTSLSDDELRYLTEVDHEDHFAIGAIRESDGTGLAIARFIRLPDREATAEAAIAVADEAKGKGLGKLMFLRLCAAATERGIERFRCELLASNTAMQSLLQQLDPDRTIETSDGVATVELDLPATAPTEPHTEATPGGAMYRLFRAAAENAVEWTESVRKLWRR
ncbi:MAG TPA: GNAT family N-acetyltransferase [Kofleriaceae bacterium]